MRFVDHRRSLRYGHGGNQFFFFFGDYCLGFDRNLMLLPFYVVVISVDDFKKTRN